MVINNSYFNRIDACIDKCPVGAITREECEAGLTDEAAAQTNFSTKNNTPPASNCPGSMAQETRVPKFDLTNAGSCTSALRQFPVQLHLVNPQAEFFMCADLLLAADCTAFACGEFHSRFLRGKMLAIACPKLDSNMQVYEDKLVMMIDGAQINTLTVLVMEVPCCRGLIRLVQAAREKAHHRKVPVKVVMLSVRGEVVSDEWLLTK